MFQLDLFSNVSLAAYTLLALITFLAAPKQDLKTTPQKVSLALVIFGTLVAYASSSPWTFAAGWILTVVPLWLDTESYSKGARWVQTFSAVALVLGFALDSQPLVAFVLIATAAVVRKGVFPFHFWVPQAFEKGSLPLLSLFLNSHLGAYVLIRFAESHYPAVASQSLSMIGTLAILTSLYGAILAIVSKRPRRILSLLCLSQAAFILAGLENRNVEGITGALLHWWVVAFATTGLLSVYRAIEVRTSEADSNRGLLGLGFHAPRLAVFFAICALALVGLPGTLGFVAEDLLFHGSLESHPLLGIALPLATALNAITALRLLANLFLGRRGTHVAPIPDASLRERWALTVPVALLVIAGIAPALLVSLRTPSAQWIASLLASR